MKERARRRVTEMIGLGLLTWAGSVSASQPDRLSSLKARLETLVTQADGVVGVAVKDLGTGEVVVVNGEKRFPMQSVYKFPLALAVLHRVDRGELALDQLIHVKKEELLPNTWSPLRDDHPGGTDLSLAELLKYVVAKSDNNGCDVLFGIMGGTKEVDRYIHGLGISEMAIAATEQEMHANSRAQFTNWCKPGAVLQLLEFFEKGGILSEKSREFLWQVMVETTTGPKRLKGNLPADITVAHKTGTSGKDDKGVWYAVNDVGIMVLPDGRQIIIAVLVTASKAPDEVSEKVIADIARTVVDHYLHR